MGPVIRAWRLVLLAAVAAGGLGSSAFGAPEPATLAAGTLHTSGSHHAAHLAGRGAATSDQQTRRFYNEPVGYPGYNGTVGFWDTRLHTRTTGSVGPMRIPYQAQFATLSVTRAITQTLPVATISSLANVRMGISLAAIAGIAPVAVPGRVAGSTISYPALVPAGPSPQARTTADLALRATVSGLDARVVFHSPSAVGAVRFSLTLAAPHPLVVRQPAGPILLEQLIPLLRRDGTPYGTQREVEYVLGVPIVRDSGQDVGAAAFTGPVRMQLSPSVSGGGGMHADVTLTVDPIWLHAVHRAYPLTLDLPILTGLAAGSTGFYGASTGTFGTVSSCAPTIRAPLARAVVGVQGQCRYRAHTYFDVTAIQPGATIQSAILTLFTPRQVGPTGVLIDPNAPPGAAGANRPPASWLPPSWDTAPAPVANVPGIPQSGSNGHVQQWDITGLVRQWIQHGFASNGGCTLVGAGAPVFFASPFGTGDDDPATAPFIEVTFAP